MANLVTVPDWLAADREWLVGQPRMTPWPDAAGPVLGRLAEWVDRYTAALRLTPGPDFGLACGQALWGCWAHHWRTAVEAAGGPVDGLEVADEIEKGRGRRGGGRLGGNVLRDVVLVQAMLHGDNTAIARFQEEHRDSITRQVGRVHRFARDDDSWWNELLAELVGVSHPGQTPKLARYNGRSGLVTWVVTVAVRFLHDKKKRLGPSGTGLTADPAGPAGGEALAVLSAECFRMLTDRVAAAIAGLDRDDRLLLRMAFVDGRSGIEIAKVLGVHPGTVTRRRQDAVQKLHARLAGGPAWDGEIGDCLRKLSDGGRRLDLADALAEVLRAAATEDQP